MKKTIIESVRIMLMATIFSLGLGIAFAWTGPTASAPSGNVDAPVNVGATGQIKQGNLIISGLNAANAAYTNGLIVLNGNVGIGTEAPAYKLDVNGVINATGIKINGVDVKTSAQNSQEFLTNGTFVVPEGVNTVSIVGCGAGGGGGSGNYTGGTNDVAYFGGGGGGGAAVISPYTISVTPGQSIPVTIGVGGVGGLFSIVANHDGGNGGSTIFGSYSIPGGYGGTGGYNGTVAPVGGNGGGAVSSSVSTGAGAGGTTGTGGNSVGSFSSFLVGGAGGGGLSCGASMVRIVNGKCYGRSGGSFGGYLGGNQEWGENMGGGGGAGWRGVGGDGRYCNYWENYGGIYSCRDTGYGGLSINGAANSCAGGGGSRGGKQAPVANGGNGGSGYLKVIW